MGTTVVAQPTGIKQVAGVLRLGDFKPPPQAPQPQTFTLDDAYGPPQNQVAGPAAPAPQANTFSIDDAYHGAPDESVGGIAAQFGSGAVRGLASLPGLPADLATLGYRGAEYLAGTPAEQRTPQDQLPWAPFGSETFRTMAERNLPLAPRDNSGGPGSYAETIGEFAGPTALTGAGILRGATNAVARGAAGPVASAIASHPARFAAGEIAAAAAGGTGSEAGRQLDPNNPMAPVIGGLAGSLAPGGIAAGLRGAVRGGEAGAQRVAQSLEDFGKLGITPTLSQATTGGYSAGQLFSRVMEFTPGGYLPSKARVAKQIDAAAQRLDQAVASAQPSEVAAGDALRAGAQRFAGKIDRTQSALEARLDRAVPGSTVVDPSETLAALQKLYEPAMAGAAPSEVGMAAISPTARSMLAKLAADIKSQGGTPFGALKAFRTRLGGKTNAGQSLIPDMAAGEAKLLYGAITRDMERAAEANGAGNIVRLRNSYYAQRKGQVEQVFDTRLPPQGSAEAVYRSVKNSDASQLRQIMRQLTPQQRRVVAGQTLREMGMPPPSGATGDTQHFSFESFDTNFEKLNRKGALDALFRFSGTQDLKAALDDIAAVAERVKGSEKFLRNPSGTAPVGIQVAGLSAVGTQVLAGNPAGALFTAGMVYGIPAALVLGGNSKTFLRLIADTGRATAETLPGHLARMAEFVRVNPEYAPVMKQILQHAGEQQQQQEKQQPDAPNQAAWNGSGGPLINAQGRAVGTSGERFTPSADRNHASDAASARVAGYPEWAVSDPGFLTAFKHGKDQAQRWLQTSAPPGSTPQDVRSQQATAAERVNQQYQGGQRSRESSYGASLPLSRQQSLLDIPSAELVAAGRRGPSTVMAGMQGIEDTRRALSQTQNLAAAGDYSRSGRDTYTQSHAPDAQIAQEAMRAKLADRLASAKSGASFMEILRQLVENETGANQQRNGRQARK